MDGASKIGGNRVRRNDGDPVHFACRAKGTSCCYQVGHLVFPNFGLRDHRRKNSRKMEISPGEGERRRTVSMEAVDIQTWTTMSMKIDNRGTEKKGYRR
jgi:hypothetical protein